MAFSFVGAGDFLMDPHPDDMIFAGDLWPHTGSLNIENNSAIEPPRFLIFPALSTRIFILPALARHVDELISRLNIYAGGKPLFNFYNQLFEFKHLEIFLTSLRAVVVSCKFCSSFHLGMCVLR